MNIFAFLVSTVFAAESMMSPLTLDRIPHQTTNPVPSVSFGDLLTVPQVLGDTTDTQQTTPQQERSARTQVTIALLGDSMVDTLGPDFPELTAELSAYYPQTSVAIINDGAGGTNIDDGFLRVAHDHEYLGEKRPALFTLHPDIVVVESFGYNPYSYDEGALDRHWMALADMVDILREYLPDAKIVIATTIAPNAGVFGDGAANISYSPTDKQEHVTTIKSYLESTTRFAESQRLPLADAYHASLTRDGNGKLEYINAGDHIHYSPEGRAFFAKILAKTIAGNHLFE